VRDSDAICRWGGEEFMILAANCNLHDAHRLSVAIHEAFSKETFFADDPDFKITVSVGITEVRPEDDEESLIARADKALYRAKDLGRNRTEAL
jgi:diguanylate cyclase (GGDEF)-like protein